MREVCIIGIGQTAISEHWDLSLRQLAYAALKAAVDDAGGGVRAGVHQGRGAILSGMDG